MESIEETKRMDEKNLCITLEAKGFLRETGKWAKFLSILGFIFLGFFVIISFFMGSLMSKANYGSPHAPEVPGWIYTVIYLVYAVIYAFPVYFLFQFSENVKKALEINDTTFLTKSLGYLKSHYKFIGILTIIFMVFFAFLLVILFFAGIFIALAS